MKSTRLRKLMLGLTLSLAFGFIVGLPQALAQTADVVGGLDTVGTTAGLSAQDPTIIVARIIRGFLGVLGIIAIVILLYAGFLWMTAGGSEERVSRAKRMIINAGIGLLIILASFGITQFVLQSLIDATTGNGGSGSSQTGGVGGLGGGSSSVFAVTKQAPTGQLSIRNVVPQITFSKNLDAATVTDASVVVTYADGDIVVPGTLTVSGNRISFVPATPCPDPNTTRFCFNENTQVNISVSTSVKSSTGTSLSCTNNLCSSSFITGTLVDTEDPVARLTLPDEGAGVGSNSLVDVQVSATDDAGVAVADFAASDLIFDSVPASGVNLTDVLIDTIWDTTDLVNGSSYRLTATVVDAAGNTDADSITVDMRPLSCFNNAIDGIETGLNCGGDSTSTEYCGACDGSSCTANNECSSGMCQAGICVSLPVITAMSPADGAPGTWVTLTGTNFGNFVGSVVFTGATGPVLADLVTCGRAWTNTQVLVMVPTGAVDGPVTLTTSSGTSDNTFDDNGQLIADFDVNTVVHPGLCDLSANSGAPNDSLALIGSGLGAARNASTVLFNNTEAGSYADWSDATVAVTVPATPDGSYAVAAVVNGVKSNALQFSVTAQAVSLPSIVSLDPEVGGAGQYVTIDGTNFGSGVGTVWFESAVSGERTLGSTAFPEACRADAWSDRQVLTIVPEALKSAVGEYSVYVVTNAGTESNRVPFTVTADAPTPGLCNVDPAFGLSGDTVTLQGSNFGVKEGAVSFFADKSASISSWSDSAVTVTVPAGAVTGEVMLANVTGEVSNAINFEVSDGGVVSAATKASTYAWSFSSGLIPDAPKAIIECSDARVTGVPNDAFDDGNGACVNSSVFVAFTQLMDQGTLTRATFEECTAQTQNPCSQTAVVPTTPTTTSLSVKLEPLVALKTQTTYRVTLPETILSAEGAPLNNATSWTFTTRADSQTCRLEKILVSPDEATIRVLNGRQDFTSLPVSGCMVLSDVSYSWGWSVDQSYAKFDTVSEPTCSAGNSTCALVQALAEGTTPVVARERIGGLTGQATLHIDFTDPYVTNTWPDCTEACTNAEVGASFNTAMNIPSVQGAGRVSLYKCTNELCTNLQIVSGAKANCTLDAQNQCTGFALSGLSLAPLTYYRVVVSGDVTSTSGVPLTRTNYGGDYSWTFRVREDATVCAVDRISLSPSAVIVSEVGDQQTFSGEAYGEADSCSVSGQRLSGFAYSWNWANPIADDDNDNNLATRVAAWDRGVLADTNLSKVAIGCTSSCTAAGSLPDTAVCGDGSVGYGEECEDGNVANGDGCSASCLREGSVAPMCGNGVVDRDRDGSGEDCDDGNLLDHDGCSATCLAEGSSSVEATCGNAGDVAMVTGSLAGEECDDGNALRGDGCSNECLWEGSPTLSDVGGALCGDGRLEAPTEQCEDGNSTDGDGCSTQCLWEGSSSAYGSKCGVNGVEYGEACDDGNGLDGDGCSADCLLEGASTLYAEPSFCGDGIAGVGEVALCEVGAAGDGKIDPIQVASITPEAVMEVDVATQQAVATIEVTEASSGLSTSATFALSCTAESDLECSDPAAYGVGAGGCCLERPTVTLFPNGNNLCRNSALYGIFTAEMDTQDFAYEVVENGVTVTKYRMYAKLDIASTGGVCPAEHTTLAVEPRNLVLRTWNKVVRFVTGRSVEAAAGDCILPITNFEQVALGDGTYKVIMHASAMLAANGAYSLIVEGDDNVNDAEVTGAVTKYGVGINGSALQTFQVGSEICALEEVRVIDSDTDSPYVFTRGDEQHEFVASGFSYATGMPQEIDSIPGVYAWNWSNWQAEKGDQIVAVTQVATAPNTATVTAAGDNGDDAVMATATIEANANQIATAAAITGSASITAFLCENPWPGSFSQLPWSDTADGDVGAEIGAGWMNFSTMYCRDAGADGLEGDMSDVTVVRPPVTESAGVIKEYLYEINGSSDAVGVRIVSNPFYLSPEAWYAAQGFTGNLVNTEVDGFKAVKDGRTTYVVAPNQTDSGDLYSNVYVISYNEGASDATIAIYTQMVENMKFAINVDDVANCPTGTVNCSSAREQLRRDTRRLTDATDIGSEISTYKSINGVVPTLPAGTFVRSLTSSAWESWGSILGGALGAKSLPTDPLNVYAGCGVAGSGYEAYNAITCVNEQLGNYVCPADSHAYHYRAVGDAEAYVYADLEYSTGTWVNAIEQDTTDGVTLSIGNSAATVDGFGVSAFCGGAGIYGASTVCGDGVVGGAEVCELGQLGGNDVACLTAGGLVGTKTRTCNGSCTGFIRDTEAECVVASCGNGVVETGAGETCDDGSKNGAYGFCGNDCTRDTAFFCGDGKLAGGEACDCGADAAMSYADARAYGAAAGSCGANVNGVYSSSPNTTCAWDCSGPAAFCGDGTLDAGEVCDGDDLTWDGKLCSASSPAGFQNQPCTTDSECGGGVCGGTGGGNRAACPVGTTRVKSCDDAAGASCSYLVNNWFNITCTEIGSCGDGTVDPGEDCDDGNLDGSDSCTDQCKANICGDGYVYVGEEQCDEGLDNGGSCDSAYGSSCTACSLSCRYAVTSGEFCGDGEKNGDEFCDANDVPYTFYNATRDTTFGSCTVLGKQKTNPADGRQYTCTQLGVCNGNAGADYNGDYCENSADCGGAECVMPTCAQSCANSCPFTYASVPLQMTTNQPGANANDVADFFSYSDDTTSDLPNAATLTVPACNVATSLTASVSLDNVDLPTTYVLFVTDLSLTMKNRVQDNTTAVFPDRSRLQIAQDAIPAAAEELFDKLDGDAMIGAIGYRGLVRGQCFYNPSAKPQDSCIPTGATPVPSGCSIGQPCDKLCSAGDFCNQNSSDLDSSLNTIHPYGTQFDFVGPDGEDELAAEVATYTYDPLGPLKSGHGTFTYEALVEAKNMFDEIKNSAAGENARYIAILLSDGEVTTNSRSMDGTVSPNPTLIAQDFDSYVRGTAGYELYTATIGDNTTQVRNMKNWSSNSYDGLAGSFATGLRGAPKERSAFNNLDYAYEADTETDLEAMYAQIVDSIVQIAVTITSSNRGNVVETTGAIDEGNNIALPWPENFVCNDLYEQQVPIKISFPGLGKVQVSDVRLNYCSP